MKLRLSGDRKILESIRDRQLKGAKIYPNKNSSECRLYCIIEDEDLLNLLATLPPDSGLLLP